MKLPRRPDRIVNPAQSANDAAWRNAVQPLDHAVNEMERKWGSIGRLTRLATPDLAAKYGSAWHRLEAALTAGDVKEVSHIAGVCIRGLTALDEAAIAQGHTPDGLVVWGVNVEGREYVVCMHDDDIRKAVARYGDSVQVWGIAELIRVARSTVEGAFAAHVKDKFPGATVQPDRPKKLPDDNIADLWQPTDSLPPANVDDEGF